MKAEQRKWTPESGWSEASGHIKDTAQLLFLFGATSCLSPQLIQQARDFYPQAHVFGCTTAGEICGTQVSDGSLIATAVYFEHTGLQGAHVRLNNVRDSLQAGQTLATSLSSTLVNPLSAQIEKLTHVLVLSTGLNVNGSDLVQGLLNCLPEGITVTGGLAGDGTRFGETLVCWDDERGDDLIAVVGLYSSRLKVGFGSWGGWDPFGPERLVTRSEGNVLYELDGQSALALYKKYLGDHAKDLPSAGLLFPLSIRTTTHETGVVRTILSIDEKTESLTFAGDIPQGAYSRLMKANLNRLIDGATSAARTSYQAIDTQTPDLAILISCVGRKLVLRQRVEEEVESVRDILGAPPVLCGFYSYGEISPFAPGVKCELHNQTMTITTLLES